MNNMYKKSKQSVYKKPIKKKRLSKNKDLLNLENPNLIIKILNLKCKVEVNEDVYSNEDKENIKNIINMMSKEIWIDKTYVDFKRNRWRDAFIVEKMWYEFCKLIIKTDFGKKGNKRDNDEIANNLLVLSLTYLYSIIEKYGYDTENIDIFFTKKTKFKCIYELDERTSWNF